MSKLKVTKGSDWRRDREEGVPVELPSGKIAALRGINVGFLIKSGKMPQFIRTQMSDMLSGRDTEPAHPTDSDTVEILDFYDDLCRMVFVNPRVVDNPQEDDEISIDDIPYMDKIFIQNLMYTPVSELNSFREKQTSNVEHLPNVENDVVQTIGDNGN